MKERPKILNYVLPLVMIALGLRHWVKHGEDLLAIVPITLGAFALYLALFNLKLLQRLQKFLVKWWAPVGQFMTGVLLTVTFYVIFAPVGILLRLFGKDILNKRFKVNCSTYWIDRPAGQDHNYTQQF